MSHNPALFLSQEVTEAQRWAIMQRTFATSEAGGGGAIVTLDTRVVYECYIVGEITLE